MRPLSWTVFRERVPNVSTNKLFDYWSQLDLMCNHRTSGLFVPNRICRVVYIQYSQADSHSRQLQASICHQRDDQLEALAGTSSTGATFFTTLAGEPIATDQSGISLVTTEEAPIVHPAAC